MWKYLATKAMMRAQIMHLETKLLAAEIRATNAIITVGKVIKENERLKREVQKLNAERA